MKITHLHRILVLVGAVLLWAAPAESHSYGWTHSTTVNGYPTTPGDNTIVWDTIPSDSNRAQCLNETSANDNDYIRLTSHLSGQSCIVNCPIDTSGVSMAGNARRLDSVRINFRVKDDGWSGKVQIWHDTLNGTATIIDTALCTTSFANKTSRKITGLTKAYISKMRIYIRNIQNVAAGDTLWCSWVRADAYVSTVDDAKLIYHDTADFRIGQISSLESTDDIWTGNRLFFGAFGADTTRLVLSIKNVDTLRTATTGASVRVLDSAYMYFMVDSVVGTPGTTYLRRPVPRDNLLDAHSVYAGRVDDDSICHTDWDHWHSAAEGASQTFCEDTIAWAGRGIESNMDYLESPLDTFTYAQSATKRIDITEWIKQLFHTPSTPTVSMSKHYWDGQLLYLPAAEYAAHAVRDTIEVSADGDTVLWTASPVTMATCGNTNLETGTLAIEDQVVGTVMTPSKDAYLDSITAYIDFSGGSGNATHKYGLYLWNGGTNPSYVAQTSARTGAKTDGWYGLAFATKPHVAAGTKYVIVAWMEATSGTHSVRIGANTGDTSVIDAATYGTFPDPLAKRDSTGYRVSIYAKCTADDYYYVDEVTAATDSLLYMTGVIDAQKIDPATEMFNFPNDTAWGATCDSLRILIHTRYNDVAGGDCSVEAGDSVIFVYDTTSSAGQTRLSKFTLTTSWATYTSSPIVAPSKAAIVQLQAGFRNYSGGCTESTVLDTHQVAWIAVERFFSTNKRTKIGNVRPLTANDSTWMEIFYHDEGRLVSDPGAGSSTRVLYLADTSRFLLNVLWDNTSDQLDDGLTTNGTIQLTDQASWRQVLVHIRDTNLIVDSLPPTQYVIDSAKLNMYVTTIGSTAGRFNAWPVRRSFKHSSGSNPQNYRESTWPVYPITKTSNANPTESAFSVRNMRKKVALDTLRVNADGDSIVWSPCGTCGGARWSLVDERSPSLAYVGDQIQLLVTNTGRGILFNLTDDTLTWQGKANSAPDSIKIRATVRFAKAVAAGDTMWFIMDTSQAAGGAERVGTSKISGIGTTWATVTSQNITGLTNRRTKDIQVGLMAWMTTASDTAFCQWIGIERYFPREKDSVTWMSVGAKDSTTADSADIAAGTLSIITWSGKSTGYNTMDIKGWIDSLQHGYKTSVAPTYKWGNSLKLRNNAGTGSQSNRTVTIANVYPRAAAASQATEIHIWATDTTLGEDVIKFRRRKMLMEQGQKDEILRETGWVKTDTILPYMEAFERDTRRVLVEEK